MADIYVYHELGLQFVPEDTHDGMMRFYHSFIWCTTDGTDTGTPTVYFTVNASVTPPQLRDAMLAATDDWATLTGHTIVWSVIGEPHEP